MGINLISVNEWRNPKPYTSTKETLFEDIGFTKKESAQLTSECDSITLIESSSEKELQEIKGVGFTLAKRISENRYKNIEDIKKIKGISPKIFSNIVEWTKNK